MGLIEKEFANRAIIRGGLYLFNARDSLDVIKRCSELGKKILGIDAFKLTKSTTQPVSEHSIDFKNELDAGNWIVAMDFIKKREQENLLFEIVYKEE